MYNFNVFLKRCFDLCSSFFAILLLTPLWIIVAIAIKLDSKGPVFFVQERRTKDGEVFKMIKFRSMVQNAEHIGTGLFNYENDSRVTKVGRILRNTSIDELPQLFNVFAGTMSIVGPRPCVKNELGDYDSLNARYKKRFKMKAGITGLAQTQGRNDISWDEKVRFDGEYIDKFKAIGILIDIKILFDSIIKVFKKENIYENKVEGAKDDVESAALAEEEIIRRAHMPEEEE